MKTLLRVTLLFVVLPFAAMVSKAQAPQDNNDTDNTPLILPAISLKYSHLFMARGGIWGTGTLGRFMATPFVQGSDGYFYGIDTAPFTMVGERYSSFIYRFSDDGSEPEKLYEFSGANTAKISPVLTANGDIYGISDIQDYCLPTTPHCEHVPGSRVVLWRIDAASKTVSVIESAIAAADAGWLYRARGNSLAANLVVNPVDGAIYGVSSNANAEGTAAIFRIRPQGDNTRLDIIYRFTDELEEQGTSGATVYRKRVAQPLSLAVDESGRLALMTQLNEPISDHSRALGALFSVDPQAVPADGTLQPLYIFSDSDVSGFYAGGNSNPIQLGTGYLVDAGNGWWYGNAYGGATAPSSVALPDARGGEIFRIRHDGSGFEVLHQFSNTCSEGTPAFAIPDKFLGLSAEEYAGLSFTQRSARSVWLYFANDDCHRDWPNGKAPLGPLLKVQDEEGNTLIYGTASLGGFPVFRGMDSKPQTITSDGSWASISYGTVFRFFTDYAEQPGGGFQLVRPFRKPVIQDAIEAATPQGLVVGSDGKLYGNSLASTLGGSYNIAYSFEFNAADIDMTHDAHNLLPGKEFTISWWAYRVTRCEAYSATLAIWNGELPLTGSRTITPLHAGNHRLEIICQNDNGTVYLEKAFTVPVKSPPLTQDLYLQLYNYRKDSAGTAPLWLLFFLAACCALRRYSQAAP